MKSNNLWKFLVVIVVIGILTCITFTGIGSKKLGSFGAIRQGIDIKGGVSAQLAPLTNIKPTKEEINSIVSIVGVRLDSKQIYDREITPDYNKGVVFVSIPWQSGEKMDPDKLIKDTIVVAKLTFWEVKEDPNGKYIEEGTQRKFSKVGTKPIMQGTDIKGASPETNTQTGQIEVSLNLKSSGIKSFADATARLAPTTTGGQGGLIGIFMDESLISAPEVNTAIPNGQCSITGGGNGFTSAEAADLAAKIRSGNLPFTLKITQEEVISPTLGQNAYNICVYALITALILVWLFMLLYYRLPGILANIALLGHTVLQLLFISFTGITITLPGIAGIILTIGMGVDANVIIFERIKEELRNGKTLRAAIDVGFRRAFAAVFDANMTTLISAMFLYIFGTGPIKSFAITLGLGVALSFLTAVTASRLMLKSAADLDVAKHHWLYGVKTVKNDVKEAKV